MAHLLQVTNLLLLNKVRSFLFGSGNKSCQWVNGRKERDESFLFELSHSLSPYVEESKMLELTVEAIDDYYILKRTKKFFLRDIGKRNTSR